MMMISHTLSEMDCCGRGCEWGFQTIALLIKLLYLWQSVEGFSASLQEGVLVVLLRGQFLQVVGILGHDEVSNGKVSQSIWLLSVEFVQIAKLWDDLLQGSFDLAFAFLVIEERADGSEDIVHNSQNILDGGFVLKSLSTKFVFFVLLGNVPMDGSGFSELVISINEVGKVGEVEAKTLLILSKPLIRRAILDILPVSPNIGKHKPGDLAGPSDTPIPVGNFVHFLMFFNYEDLDILKDLKLIF